MLNLETAKEVKKEQDKDKTGNWDFAKNGSADCV